MKEDIGYFDGSNIRDEYDTCISSYLDDINFAKSKFEILSEEDEKIDIEAIEEMRNPKTWKACDSDIISIVENVNTLTKAIKQLTKEIQDIN